MSRQQMIHATLRPRPGPPVGSPRSWRRAMGRGAGRDQGRSPARGAGRGDRLFGSRIGGPAALGEAAADYDSLLKQVAAGEIGLDIDPVPLARVEQAWPRAGSDRRIVFVP
jgi:hypothetical protein